ncbi:MAG: type II toxin-antitoxin system RelE/ParE family toxin [Beijerinckiaceae bacterium]|nr:type II toxin-antitoxin system RelE/ParE family toxin [Beijerinckiaceae bacterium]
MKVIFAGKALQDLQKIGAYVEAYDPNRAAPFVDGVIGRCESLGNMPSRYPLIPRYESRGIRRRTHGNYLSFYRIKADVVEILHNPARRHGL